MIQNNKDRYLAAAHAMQTGVAFVMERNPSETSPKHLRVGVNSAMVDSGAIVHLLIKKGLITEDEWWGILADTMEHEAAMYKERVEKIYGSNVNIA